MAGREWTRLRQWLAMLVTLGAALGVGAGCDDKSHDRADYTGTSTAHSGSARTSDGDCGENVADSSALVSLGEFGVVAGVAGVAAGRSASVLSLDDADCRDVGTGEIPAGMCAAETFPWTVSSTTQSGELYGRGVTRISRATFEISGRAALREVILDGSSHLVTTYAAHARGDGSLRR